MTKQFLLRESSIKKTSSVICDNITEEVSLKFDIDFNGVTEFHIDNIPSFPKKFKIGLIVGPSGSGKSTILERYFQKEKKVKWDKDKAIVSHFDNTDDAIIKLTAVGLNSIKSWLRPFHLLSNGEQFRATMARSLESKVAIDEFTSVVDRSVAKSVSCSINKYVHKNDLNKLIFVTCHYDIIKWLRPCWVYDLNTNTIYSGRWLQRPKITIKVYEGDHTAWEIFRKHHYLSGTLLGNSKCFLFFWKNLLVGFVATSTLPSGTVKKAYREHRLVVLPDYQGLGIGSTISEYTAKIMLSKGKRYFSRTSHYKMGEYRNKSDVWRPTSSNMTSAVAEQGTMKNWTSSDGRMCYSHEYIGK